MIDWLSFFFFCATHTQNIVFRFHFDVKKNEIMLWSIANYQNIVFVVVVNDWIQTDHTDLSLLHFDYNIHGYVQYINPCHAE